MITVLIQTNDEGEALSRTLVPLVEGAMEGVISNVLVFTSHDGVKDEIDRICDLSGAKHCSIDDMQAEIQQAKDKWLLVLEAGARLEGDWLSGVVHHMNNTQNLGRFALASGKTEQKWWQRIFVKPNNGALRAACLMPKTIALNAAKTAADLDSMARGRAMKMIDGGRIQPAE